MKRISTHLDLFEANPGEDITITIQARHTPLDVTFSKLDSGQNWIFPPGTNPPDATKRLFTMPVNREFFVVVYGFPPPESTDLRAEYLVKFTSNDGTSDGPRKVLPPSSGTHLDLPYDFRAPNAPLRSFLPEELAEALENKEQ
jgi:hypothetical protein